MVGVLVDTSVLIEKIRRKKGMWDVLIKLREEEKVFLYTSSVVLTELWAGESMNEEKAVENVSIILRPLGIMAIDTEIGKKAGDLVRGGQATGFDGLIAATCLVHKIKLATLNIKHFKQVKGLKFFGKI